MHRKRTIIETISIANEERINEASFVSAFLCDELIHLCQNLVCNLSLVIIGELLKNVAFTYAIEIDGEFICAHQFALQAKCQRTLWYL